MTEPMRICVQGAGDAEAGDAEAVSAAIKALCDWPNALHDKEIMERLCRMMRAYRAGIEVC